MHGTLCFKQEKKVSRFIKLVLRNSCDCTDVTIIQSQLALRTRLAFARCSPTPVVHASKIYIHNLALSCFKATHYKKS